MVLGVEEDGIAEYYPVEDQGSEAAAGTASDLGDRQMCHISLGSRRETHSPLLAMQRYSWETLPVVS
ncbi:unnamed protein product [Arctogadus glacialis]